MKYKRIEILFLTVILTVGMTSSCSGEKKKEIEPNVEQMRSICELATLECYYHNVAKYEDKNNIPIIGDLSRKKFWIEYEGIVKVGIDMSKVKMNLYGDRIEIAIPQAEILSCKVDENSLSKDSYITDTGIFAGITAEDETKAFSSAQQDMEEATKKNTELLASAQERAKTLIKNYVDNLGKAVGKTYTVSWVESTEDGKGTNE